MVAVRAMRRCRKFWRMPRAGYNYNAAAVPGTVAPVADTAGKGDYAVEKDLLFVSDQLGHSNVSATQIYAKTDSESRRKQVEKMLEK